MIMVRGKLSELEGTGWNVLASGRFCFGGN
jgi:hypothetical protein